MATIVSVNNMLDEMSLELKGNLARVGACVFSAPKVVGYIAKSTPPPIPAVELQSGGDASKNPELLSAVIHTGDAVYWKQGHQAWHRRKASFWAAIVGEKGI